MVPDTDFQGNGYLAPGVHKVSSGESESAMAQRPLRDWRGRTLCEHCWNGAHWHHKLLPTNTPGKFKKGSTRISDCESTFMWDGVLKTCQCECVVLLTEKHRKPKQDHSQQMVIDVPMEQIGPKQHREDN